jgi:two-component system chemotaxis sensor kinase CheA
MGEFEIEIKKGFLDEAHELLQSAEKAFLELELDPTNKALIDTIFRFAHNLKGTSSAVGFGEIAELTHKAENLLLEIKNDKVVACPSVVTTLLRFSDKVREMVEGLSLDLEAKFNVEELLRELDLVQTRPPTSEEVALPQVVEEETAVIKTPKCETKKDQRKDDETIRVSLNRLEKLNDFVGELVILQTLVESSLNRVGENKTARSLGKLCKSIQDLSMSLRMVPVGPTFQKLNRVVRDTSKLLGKDVELRLLGEDTEIDKTIVENLSDPLVHMIRNAIDHGIEAPEERIAGGKTPHGVVEVMAFHEGNFLVIQITDDGKGIHSEVLIAKAREKGIIPEHVQLTEQQGVELIFHPGLSSKEVVSEVSGRGVGMDVVKTNIEALGGEVKVRSKLGAGTCFRLMLPLTLAIIEGMLIESGNNTFVIPKSQVQQVTRLNEHSVTANSGRVPYLTLRDEVLPLFNLDQDIGSGKELDQKIALIVKHGDAQFAVVITDVIRLQQVVVKPATNDMNGKSGIMGTTILGNGQPSLIIDLLSLYMKRVRKESSLEYKRAS